VDINREQLLCDRAASGAEHLDRVRPGWHDEINTESLDISCKQHCTAGQLTGEYTAQNCDQLGVHTYEQKITLGFFIEYLAKEEDYDLLTEVWKWEILMRREQHPVEPEPEEEEEPVLV